MNVLSLIGLAISLLGATATTSSVYAGTLHHRTFFYIGQKYNTTGPSAIAHGQVYVERLTPAKIIQPYPLLFIHGHGMTGTNFIATADGKPGWADYFLSKGYEVYLTDQPARGRSTYQQTLEGPQSAFPISYIESHFTSPERYNLWPGAFLHTQWPGNGSAGDPIFDNFYAATVPSLNSEAETSEKVKDGMSALLDRIGPVVLVTHSQSGQHGWILGDARPSQVKAIVALEPIGPPFTDAVFTPAPARPYGLTDIPVQYSPPITSPEDLHRQIVSVSAVPNVTCIHQASPARQLVNLLNIPVLLVTSEAGYHDWYDNCTAGYLRQAGVSVDHIRLGEVGFHGNGHMFFLEKNSLEIADGVVQAWLKKHHF